VQANAKVTIKCEYDKVLCNLLNGVISNDLHDLESRVSKLWYFSKANLSNRCILYCPKAGNPFTQSLVWKPVTDHLLF